jgi:hypothetical protein
MSNIDNNDKSQAPQDITQSIFAATNRLIDALEHTPSKKTTIRDLIDKVCAETGAKSSVVAGLVPMYVHGNSKISVEVGRSGGIYFGGKPKKVDTRQRCNTCNQVLRFNKLKPSEFLVDDTGDEDDITNI